MNSPLPPVLQGLTDRPVAVLGAGVSGSAVRELLASLGLPCVVYDERGGEGITTRFTRTEAINHRLVIHSPGFAQNHAWLTVARASGCVHWGELDFASLFWPGPVLAVTGTNGKTTLTEFLAFALKRAGRPAIAVGNNGYAFARAIAEGSASVTAVCEVSSFQSELLRALNPRAVIWTNFDEDHLDRHFTMGEYFHAKLGLALRAPANRLYVGESVALFARSLQQPLPAGHRIVPNLELPGWNLPESSPFRLYPQRENLNLALAWWADEGLSEQSLRTSAALFTARQHRLSRVADVGGVSYWNDSKATNFHAVHAALAEFPSPVLWIGGGKPKGGDIAGFADRLVPRVKQAFLIGETAPFLLEKLSAAGVPARVFATLPAAVQAAGEAASPADNVLLSPGFASFDMFQSYAHRGTVFEQAVLGLKPAK